jgi:hypothetical protein
VNDLEAISVKLQARRKGARCEQQDEALKEALTAAAGDCLCKLVVHRMLRHFVHKTLKLRNSDDPGALRFNPQCADVLTHKLRKNIEAMMRNSRRAQSAMHELGCHCGVVTGNFDDPTDFDDVSNNDAAQPPAPPLFPRKFIMSCMRDVEILQEIETCISRFEEKGHVAAAASESQTDEAVHKQSENSEAQPPTQHRKKRRTSAERGVENKLQTLEDLCWRRACASLPEYSEYSEYSECPTDHSCHVDVEEVMRVWEQVSPLMYDS